MLSVKPKEGTGRIGGNIRKMATHFPPQDNGGLIRQYLAHQQTMPYQAITDALPEPVETSSPFSLSDTYQSQAMPEIPEIPEPIKFPPTQSTKKPPVLRVVAVVLMSILVLSIYIIWHGSSPSTTTPVSTTQQQFNLAPTTSTLNTEATASPATASGKIQVYIVGAVKKPGVYTLETNARVYELLQVAGGPLPDADLVALNLAARLTDGQEIYVTRVGETPPVTTSSTPGTNATATTATTAGSQVNINTASANDLRTGLHISSANAQAIISYRLQHGPYTSVEELLQVVSQTVYKKIKDQVKLA